MRKQNDKLIVVSGCPRSGTSLMMDCLRIALGKDRIIGSKFPQEEEIEQLKAKRQGETEDEHKARLYVINKRIQDDFQDIQVAKDMNPNGFWECQYTVQGIKWHMNMPDIRNRVCKIVSQGIFRSNPTFIDGIILMVRDPRQVAKSQERLKRIPFAPRQEENRYPVHDPFMFIQVSYMFSQWAIFNSDIPIQIISFDELISSPAKALAQVRAFLGEGDFSQHPIDPKLKRSYAENFANHLWEHADVIYNMMLSGKFKDVVDYYEANKKNISMDKIQTYCTRMGRITAFNECELCQRDATTVKNFIRYATRIGIDWQNEPCLYECLTSQKLQHISIEKSIKNNHWLNRR